jgi:hypothetical protein
VKTPSYTLAGVAIFAFLMWRGEVELNGWAGLGWIGYWHAAVPVAGLSYAIWAKFGLHAIGARAWWVVVGFGLWGIAAWLILRSSCAWYFIGGPEAMLYLMDGGDIESLTRRSIAY